VRRWDKRRVVASVTLWLAIIIGFALGGILPMVLTAWVVGGPSAVRHMATHPMNGHIYIAILIICGSMGIGLGMWVWSRLMLRRQILSR
jgi:hypothetical protein